MKIECNVIVEHRKRSYLFIFGDKKRFNSDKTAVVVFETDRCLKSKEIKRIK